MDDTVPLVTGLLIAMQTVRDLCKQRGFRHVPDPMFASSQTLPALRLSAWGTGDHFMPVQQIGQLSLPDFAKIYTVSLPLLLVSIAKTLQ